MEIAKALSHDLKVLVLDEPTAPLTNEDTEHLFQILNRVRETGASIIFITHRLPEVLRSATAAPSSETERRWPPWRWPASRRTTSSRR